MSYDIKKKVQNKLILRGKISWDNGNEFVER